MTEIQFLTAIPLGDLVIRLLASAVLGLVLGIDRELHDRPAGIRTFMFISLASCVFSLITIEMMSVFGGPEDRTQLDPIRVVEAVTAGVAFLGAGTIFRMGANIKGLTTGAGMWLAGAVGLACGTGMLGLAGLTTLLAVIIFLPLRLLEHRIFPDNSSENDQG